MNKPNNWESVKAATERVALPAGGYIVKILDAKVKTYTSDNGSFDKLEISLDITDGEFKDFYANDYRSQTQEDKKWKGMLRQYTPKDDGSEKDEWTKSSLKALTDAIEESNPGYHWDWNEDHLKGKVVGCLFRSEEWQYNGKEGWKTQPFKFVSVETIKSGKFKVPNEKPLKNKSVTQSEPAYENIADSDLPF
jgi:hypothetical protein